MEKKQVETRILNTGRSCTHFRDNRYRWGEVLEILKEKKVVLQDTDILEVGYTEGYDHGDSSRDDHYDLTVIRCREETDEEFEKRKNTRIEAVTNMKKNRYNKYLELKKEFDEE
jgi:hypothetical protein